jgi:transposase
MPFTLMSTKELRVASTIVRLLKGDITNAMAAEMLRVTKRTVRRMKGKVRLHGQSALAHGSRGKPGNRSLDGRVKEKLECLLLEKYPDFGPTLATEKLFLDHAIDLDPKTVRTTMMALGLWKGRARKTVEYRAWRLRRAMYGALVQYDGSYHAWLEDRWTGPDGTHELCLLLAIDDATGIVTQAYFAPHEGLLPTLKFWLKYAIRHGLPHALYVDRFSTYKLNMKLAAENEDTKTQFGMAMKKLGVEIIFAHSPQAKGRVERVFGTLQDRLVKELRLAGISDPEEANVFIAEKFLPAFNASFGVPPREEGDMHRALTKEEAAQYETIFCREDERTVCADFTVSHEAIWYQLEKTPRLTIRPKDKVVVRTSPDGVIALWLRGKRINTSIIKKARLTFRDRLELKKRTFLIPGKADISISR